MGDVLTNDQHLDDTKPWHNAPGYPRETDRAFMARMREAAADRNTVGKNDHSHMLTLYDRLVSEVERLRARNEKLEQVAKAVVEITHKMYQDREARGWCQDYYNALSDPSRRFPYDGR